MFIILHIANNTNEKPLARRVFVYVIIEVVKIKKSSGGI
jgi:hypothetical protein